MAIDVVGNTRRPVMTDNGGGWQRRRDRI